MTKAKRFGTFGGVFTPSILTILGVIMYLRLPWIVGQAGLLATLGIILVAHIISGSTGLSVASIATDKRVETGGTYYIISRSLGLPIGGTLGWALFVGLSFSVSLYLIGFAEVFLGYFGFEVNLTTIRIAGSIILFLVLILTFISTSLAIKTQYIILTAMVLSVLSVILGRHEYTPETPQLESLPGSLPWIALFAIFFPAVTGFEAGVSMSGDLKDPRRAIPLGTISAILTGLTVYVILAFFFSYTVSSEMLVNDPNVLFKISLVQQFVIAGILGATLSSALGSILGAPRIMQAVAGDRIAPFFFSKGYGPSNEPRNALLLTYLIAQAGILIGELNAIARIVTIFFIITYGFLNITYTVESWASSDFRPSFKIPRFVSIIGSIACIVVMIQLDIMAMAGASVILLALFFYLKNKELNLQTGDTRSSIWLSLVKTGLLKLTKSKTNARNWRPNVILFSGGAKNRPHLIELGKTIVGRLGIFTNFELIEQPDENLLFEKKVKVSAETIGEHTDIITRKHLCSDIYEGIEMISRVYGFSGFEPNTILMGWAKNTRNPEKFQELLINLNKLDYSITFLNYNKEKGFGNYKNIDFWWNGKGRNLAFALHLIRFITATTEWRNAQIRILAINPTSKNTERFYAIIGQTLDNYRIRANVKIIQNPEKSKTKDIIRSESSDTDLIITEFPEFDKNVIPKVIASVNELTENLNTCVLLHASSEFEEINIISDLPAIDKRKTKNIPGDKPEASIADKIEHSTSDIVFNEVYNLAQILEKDTGNFLDNTLFTFPEKREIFLDQMESVTHKALDRLIKTDKIKSLQEKQWEYLKILNDFTFHVQKQISVYITDHLNYEKEIIINGFPDYLKKTETTLINLPRYLRLRFGINDFKKLTSGNVFKRLINNGIILWLKIKGNNIGYKINLHPVANFFIYYKILEYYRQFIREYTAQHLSAFTRVREYLSDSYELLSNARAGNLTQYEIIEVKDKALAIIREIKDNNQKFVYDQGYTLVNKLIENLTNFTRTIESPRANSLSQKFRLSDKKIAALEAELSETPDIFFQYIGNYMNRTYLDFVFITLKSRITTKVEKAYQDMEVMVEGNILSKLRTFENQVRLIAETGSSTSLKKEFISSKTVIKPDFDELLTSLFREIHELVEFLPESIEIAEEGTGEISGTGNIEELSEYIVSVRRTADYYVSNELNDQIRKQSVITGNELSLSVTAIRDLIRLAGFSLISGESADNRDETDSEKIQEQRKTLLDNLFKNIGIEERKIREVMREFKFSFNTGIKNAFESLSSAVILKTSTGLNKKIKESGKRMNFRRLEKLKNAIRNNILNQSVNILYSQSEGLLWAKRMEGSRENTLLHPGEQFSKMLKKLLPEPGVMQRLPFYYSSLFSGSSGIGEDFWIGMEDEIKKGSAAIKHFLNRTSGLLIITGERSSGKSSLSKHLANLHFEKENIYSVRAPKESIADKNLFTQTLLKSINKQDDPEYCLDMLPPGTAIIINDLELWWERKPFGTQVIDYIIHLSRQYGHKVLFIININRFALKIINQLTSLNTWAREIILCQPFDARELKDLILLRHKAGGMKFIMDNKHETDYSNWDYARLFNRIFSLSAGNPGYAINLWLAGIKKVTGNSLIMEKPFGSSIALPDNLSKEEWFYIMQFVLHRRFSSRSLAEILLNEIDKTENTIRILLQKGILIEKFPGVFSLNPALEIHLAEKLINLELL